MEGKFRNKYRINSARKPGHNYGMPGFYFITICTKNRICYFGNVINGKMVLSDIGRIIVDEWIKTSYIRSNVRLGEWVVMPNHVHMIVRILENNGGFDNDVSVEKVCNVETHRDASLHEYNNTFGPQRNNVASIIRGFKGVTTKRIHMETNYSDFAWQSRFYDRIIRNEYALYAARQYIINNPIKWDEDNNNPIHFS